MAESALKDLSVDSSVRVLEKLREKWVRDQVTDIKYATQKGHAEGMQKGIEKGMQKGIEKGMQKGMQKGRQEGMQAKGEEIVLNMLKKQADMAFISEVTGLSVDEIKKLKNGA